MCLLGEETLCIVGLCCRGMNLIYILLSSQSNAWLHKIAHRYMHVLIQKLQWNLVSMCLIKLLLTLNVYVTKCKNSEIFRKYVPIDSSIMHNC